MTTDRIIAQGQALVRAIEALDVIEPTGPLERLLVGLLQASYKRRLRSIVGNAPAWVSEMILSASSGIEKTRPATWMSDN